MATKYIPTRFLIISDTHGEPLQHEAATSQAVDVVIHCGDLTEESKLVEFRSTIDMMKRFDASLKIMIAGNHDFTLDDGAFAKKSNELRRLYASPGDDIDDLIKREYGAPDEARSLLESARSAGILFLEEGNYSFDLSNGAHLKLYCSPYTPSSNDWAFQYEPQLGHDWKIDHDVDVIVTHGPPEGILDRPPGVRERLGCPSLFSAIYNARPRMHCFGHVHSCWGARDIAWRESAGHDPFHMSAIDNDASTIIDSLTTLTPSDADDSENFKTKSSKYAMLVEQGYRHIGPRESGRTLFVNAAIKGECQESQHLPWLVDLNLDASKQSGS